MNNKRIYILGGYQSDFSRNWHREGSEMHQNFADILQRGLQQAKLESSDIDVGHVGNFAGELFVGQGQLGGFFGQVDEDLHYLPASRHEAACASGSMAILAAMADLESERYSMACVLGIEMMRNVGGQHAADYLGAAAWVGHEWQDAQYLWPQAFDDLLSLYQERYGLEKSYLTDISKKNYHNARNNPNAQTRSWSFTEQSFAQGHEHNPVVAGGINRLDCGQVSDGGAVVFLATESRANEYAKSHGLTLDQLPYIRGWGHVNAPIEFAKKRRLSDPEGYILPHVNKLFEQTLQRAGLEDIHLVDGLEVHDCFNITEYMILDHSGFNAPGELWQSIEAGHLSMDGKLPVNMSGGLIGGGHPVGATGVRMLLNAYQQVSHQAGDMQLDSADNIMTINIGGSTTTAASFIVSR